LSAGGSWPGRPGSPAGAFESQGWQTTAPGAPRRRGSERVIPSILLVIAIQIVVQIPLAVWMIAGHAETDTVIRVVIAGTLAYYGLVAAFVLWRFGGREITPVWSSARAGPSALVGVAAGLAMALPISALLSLLSGHIASDSFALLVASERSAGRLIAGAVLLVVCAPLVEEWLFRGLLAESLRDRGRWAALLVSSLLFAIWHLRFAATQYYILVGLVLAGLYLRRGLVASMSAHATFNGTLLVLAVVAAHLGPHTVEAGDVSLRVPATWQEDSSTTAGLDPPSDSTDAVPSEVALRGPTRALLSVFSEQSHAPSADVLTALERRARQGGLRTPVTDFEVDAATVFVADLPTGRALRMLGRVDGRRVELVILPKAERIWTLVLRTAGSYRASKDFEQILRQASLR
jgi:membrane protease YdiL (CAAX protease family)